MDVNLWTAAAPYLSHLAPEYWTWDENSSAITWIDGPTITFRQELAIVLRRHTQRGLPPLVPLLLVLAARRASWPESASRLVRIVSERGSIERHMPEWIDEVLTRLESIHLLPVTGEFAPYVTADLVDHLFDPLHPRASTPEGAAAVLGLMEGATPREWLRVGAKGVLDLWHELGVLRKCLRNFSLDAFARWRQTSVPAAVEPAEEPELPPHEQARRLLVNLSTDAELGGVARLARQVLALVTLPRPVSHPDGMPLGGYSDIANRGSLDRLLISELAHDDLTLAVRLANNEALYVRRETPPSPPPANQTH